MGWMGAQRGPVGGPWEALWETPWVLLSYTPVQMVR